MRVLLLGAGGLLGTDLATTAPPAVELTSLIHQQLDVTDALGVERVVREMRPEVIVNATGANDVDGAEQDARLAHLVNGAAPGILGNAALKAGARVVHYSTDYVFDGTLRRPLGEDDAPHPINQYGKSKLEGEHALAASGADFLIVRTQWLFGLQGRSFPRVIWERAHERRETRVVNDQFGRPTYTVDLATATWRLVMGLTMGQSGIRESGVSADRRVPPFGSRTLHVANTGIATWYDVARRVFRAVSADGFLQPCTSAEFPRAARRPAWSALDTTRHDTLTGHPLPAWEDALGRFLSHLMPGVPAS